MFARSKDHTKMANVRDLQAALSERDKELQIKENRIQVLESELKRKDEQIRKIESELDKYRSVLKPTTTNVPKSRLPRLGISAEPTFAKHIEERISKRTASLDHHDKSLRQAIIFKHT